MCKFITRGMGRHFKYKDQILNNGTYVKPREFEAYLLATHNISRKEYYDIVINGGVDKSPKCFNPNCNKESLWIGFPSGYRKYCSKSCQTSHQHTLEWRDLNHSYNSPEFRRKRSDNANKLVKEGKLGWSSLWNSEEKRSNLIKKYKELVKEGKFGCNSISNKIEMNRNSMLTKSKNHELYNFYLSISKDEGIFKIGVSIDPYRQIYRLITPSEYYIYEGNPSDCINLEADLKYLKDSDHNSTEVFDIDQLESIMIIIEETPLTLIDHKVVSGSTTIP